MKRFIIAATILYLSIGFIFAFYDSYNLRTFRCDDPNAPHGYVIKNTRLFENPDPAHCARQGLELQSVGTIPIFTVLGVPILIARGIAELRLRVLEEFRDTYVPPADVAEFTEKIQSFVIENFGQPIDSGFTAPMYLRAFPGLLQADFDEVETSEGKYEYSDGELSFIRTQTGRWTTFDEAILEKGHETLLSNIRGRLGINLSIDELITGIIAQGIGRVIGTILLGPTCPVVKDPPDEACADKPVFGTFIVKDIAGVNEITRFSTQQDGGFSVSLPAGEYSIESETPLGLGIQAHRIEVQANETSEYTITFDTGIR